MVLDWLPRDNEIKDHSLFKGKDYFGTEPPCTMYEKKPCIFAGYEYPHASEVCESLKCKRCNNGKWEETGKKCPC